MPSVTETEHERFRRGWKKGLSGSVVNGKRELDSSVVTEKRK
jgi:hypothetical protein